eukprot:gene11685-biopygen10932
MRRRRRRPGENERKIRAIRGKYGGEADFSGTVLYWIPSMSGNLGDLRRGEGAIPRPWNAGGGPRRAMRRGQQTIHSMFARAALRPRPSPPPPPEVAASAVPSVAAAAPPVADAGRNDCGRAPGGALCRFSLCCSARRLPCCAASASSSASAATSSSTLTTST